MASPAQRFSDDVESIRELEVYGSRYEDTGCEVYFECLSCPLPRCVEEVALSIQLTRMRDSKIVSLYFDHNLPASEIPNKVSGISRHIVKNVLEKERRYRRQNQEEVSDYRDYLIDISLVKGEMIVNSGVG